MTTFAHFCVRVTVLSLLLTLRGSGLNNVVFWARFHPPVVFWTRFHPPAG